MSLYAVTPLGIKVPVDTMANASSRADLANTVIHITSELTVSESDNGDYLNDRAVVIDVGGSLANSTELQISGPFSAGMYHVFKGAGKITFNENAVPEVSAEWFGAGSQTADSLLPVNAALQSINHSNNSQNIPVKLLAPSYTTTAAFDVDVMKSSLIGNNTLLNLDNTTGATINIYNGEYGFTYNPFNLIEGNSKNKVSGFKIWGPGQTASGGIGVKFTPRTISSVDYIPNVTLENISFSQVETGVKASNGVNNLTMRNITVEDNGAGGAGHGVETLLYFPSGLTNAGKGILVDGLTVTQVDNTAALFRIESNNVNLTVQNATISDVSNILLMAGTGGRATFKNCLITGAKDTSCWFAVNNGNNTLLFDNCVFLLTDSKTTYAIATCADVQNGIILNNCSLYMADSKTYTPFFFSAGVGRVVAVNCHYTTTQAMIGIAASTNKMHFNGKFDNAYSLVTNMGWQIVTGTIVRDNAKSRSTTYSCRLDGVSGVDAVMVFDVPITYGQVATIRFYYQTGALHSGTLNVAYIKYGSQANTSVTTAITTTDNVSSWTLAHVELQPGHAVGEAGVYQLEVKISVSGVASSTGSAWIDDVYIDVI